MGNYLSSTGFNLLLPALAIGVALVLAGFLTPMVRDRGSRLRRNTEVFWFSSLHFFNKELSECKDPQQMADHSLRGAMEMLDAQEGFMLVHQEGDEGNVQCSTRGVS